MTMIAIFKYYPDSNIDMVIAVDSDKLKGISTRYETGGITPLFAVDVHGAYGYFQTEPYLNSEDDYLDFGTKCYLRSVITEHYPFVKDKLDKIKTINAKENASGIKIHSMARGSGKTFRAINMFKDDDSVILVVGHKNQKYIFQKDYGIEDNQMDRIICFSELLQFIKDGRTFRGRKLVIDEAFAAEESILLELFYKLGQLGVKVECFGTTKSDSDAENNFFGIEKKLWNEVLVPILEDKNNYSNHHLNVVVGERGVNGKLISFLIEKGSECLEVYKSSGITRVDLKNGEKHTFMPNVSINSTKLRGRKFSSIRIVK